MEPILNFAQLTAHLKKLNHRKRIAVVCANDPNTCLLYTSDAADE